MKYQSSKKIQGFSLVEMMVALSLLSIATLATVSLIVSTIASYQRYQGATNIVHRAANLGERLRQGTWLSGYQVADNDLPVELQGVAPTKRLGLRYKINGDGKANRYDCSRSKKSGIRINQWYVRSVLLPGIKAEMACDSRSLAGIASGIIGMDAQLLGHDQTLSIQGNSWKELPNGSKEVHAIAVDLLMQHPNLQHNHGSLQPPFLWSGVSQQPDLPVIWVKLRLPRAMD